MRRLACLLAFSLLFGVAAKAQERADAFLGYSYVRQTDGSNVNSFNLNGGVAQIAAYPVSWFGLVGEFGLYTPGTISFSNIPATAHPSGGDFSYLFGPRISFRHGPLQPYVQGLFGGYHISAALQQTLGTSTANTFAMAVGGGLDLKVTKHFAIRLAQVDYFLTRLNSPLPTNAAFSQNNFRYSGGIVFRF
jgi:opacity protein-like surface antigen